MSLLIESIRLDDGVFHNLIYHQRRVDKAFSSLFTARSHNLEELLRRSSHPVDGLYKCRIVYDAHSAEVSFVPYNARPIRSIKVVIDDGIRYDCKFAERKALDNLFAMRAACDDVLIVRNGEVTDSSIANIAFSKAGRWFTPAHPLLAGTMRQSLIDAGKIEAAVIRKEQIPSFESFRLINAMVGFDSPEQDVGNIIL